MESGAAGLENNRDSHQLLEGQSFEAGKLSDHFYLGVPKGKYVFIQTKAVNICTFV